MTVTEIRQGLMALQDIKYKDFQCKLIPEIEPERVIGVRTPQLRAYARQLAKDPDICDFLDAQPHRYYDECNLHGFIISEIKDYDECIKRIDSFLSYVDNWATCDLVSPKAFKHKTNHDKLLTDIRRWMASSEPFTIRFGMETLMRYFLDDEFEVDYLEWVAADTIDHYYVKMMVAWFFATALAKQWDATLPYIIDHRLPVWTHNKAIQKAIESYRIDNERKDLLRTMKIKNTLNR